MFRQRKKPENGGKERLPTLFVYQLNDPYYPKAGAAARRRADWAFALTVDVEGDEGGYGGFAKAIQEPYWDSEACDQILTSFDCSPCGRYQASIWEYRATPSQSGAVVQWNRTTVWHTALVMETEMPASRRSARPLLCKVNERGDTVVVLVGRRRNATALLASIAPSDLEVRVYTIGSGFEADTQVPCQCLADDDAAFDRWFPVAPAGFFVHAATVAANRAMPQSQTYPTLQCRMDDRTSALSPCGRYFLVVMGHAPGDATSVANNGGVAIFDLQEALDAAAVAGGGGGEAPRPPTTGSDDEGRRCTWRPHARDMAPRALVWNRAGLWLQTARGVLLVGLV